MDALAREISVPRFTGHVAVSEATCVVDLEAELVASTRQNLRIPLTILKCTGQLLPHLPPAKLV